MGNSCDVPLRVSAGRVSRIAWMNHVSVTIVAIAFAPAKSPSRTTGRCAEEEIGSDDTLGLMRYFES
jgi:hypothetical protein